LKIYVGIAKFPKQSKNHEQNKIIIIAGTMNWGVWDKTSIKEMESMIHICLENKISSLTMLIFMELHHRADFGQTLAASKIARERMQISKCGIQMLAANRNNTIKHYDYSKEHIIIQQNALYVTNRLFRCFFIT
jgi:predicted oxidoreductase